jgi:hypothetical protein
MKDESLAPVLRQKAQALVDRVGFPAAVRAVGTTREVFLRILAGQAVRVGTGYMFERRLSELEAGSAQRVV